MACRMSGVLLAAPLLLLSLGAAAQSYQGKTVYITSSQTWTVPANVTTIYARLVGGGGGGFADNCFGTPGGTGGSTTVTVSGVTAQAFGGTGAHTNWPTYSCTLVFQGIGGGSSNCDYGVVGGNGESVGSKYASAAGGSPFMYGDGGASTQNPTQFAGVGYGYGGSGMLGAGAGVNTAGGGAGGYCERAFSVTAGTQVTVTVGAGGSAGYWGTAGKQGVVVITY